MCFKILCPIIAGFYEVCTAKEKAMKALLRPIVDKIRTHLMYSTHQRLDKLSMLLGRQLSLHNSHLASKATLGGGQEPIPSRI